MATAKLKRAHDLSDAALIDFIIRMKRKARRKGRAVRVAYTQAEREKAILLYNEADQRGGTLADVAEMLGMHQSTLLSWIEKATQPGSNWNLGNVNLSVLYDAALRGLE